MCEILTDIEKLILSKVFEGDFSPFKDLSGQIDKVKVSSRRKDYHTYDVQFSLENMDVTPLVGDEENIKINDTVFYINEADVTLHVSVTVMYGRIKYLLIGGKYHFEKDDFSAKDFAWKVRNDDPLKEASIVHSANKRDFKKAISYIPMYK